MDKEEAIQVLIATVNIYLSVHREDFEQEENQDEYVEILQALEVLRG